MATRYGLYMLEITVTNGKYTFREIAKHFTTKTQERPDVEMRSLAYVGNSQLLFGFLRDPLLYLFNYE